jgi:hypothetical protein
MAARIAFDHTRSQHRLGFELDAVKGLLLAALMSGVLWAGLLALTRWIL